MFESMIKELTNELDTKLQPNVKKCYELKGKATNIQTKAKLERKYMELSHAINCAALCISILKSECFFNFSEDKKTVTVVFP